MLLANLKQARGLNATGVVGVACSRHEMWRPNGLGDLQRGERCVYLYFPRYIVVEHLPGSATWTMFYWLHLLKSSCGF